MAAKIPAFIEKSAADKADDKKMAGKRKKKVEMTPEDMREDALMGKKMKKMGAKRGKKAC